MKPFLQHCIGISILVFALAFFIRSVEPAFAGKNSSRDFSAENTAGPKSLWVNIDSIDAKYMAFADLTASAGFDYKKRLQDYQDSAKILQDRYDLLQQKSQMGIISSDEAMAEEKAINAGMERLKIMESELALAENSAMEKNTIITDDITRFLAEYATKKHADYIFGHGGDANILYGNPDLDVTDQVLKELNERYKLGKKQK